MDNECKNFLKNNGFGNVISELSDIGIKSLNELEGLSNEDIESKTSLKPLQAKKLYDMMQNPRHPKSPMPVKAVLIAKFSHLHPVKAIFFTWNAHGNDCLVDISEPIHVIHDSTCHICNDGVRGVGCVETSVRARVVRDAFNIGRYHPTIIVHNK